ncbi:BatA and WFA domain-containing protein [Bhargavaea ullalensis]|uniref:von Willebrand factor type A domain-containing protein n=1 Tax=Bhargavaea ullalensis TaxID=1265685 RepID=A0ABV2GCC7_9BACL
MEIGSPGMLWTAVIPAAVVLYYFFTKRYDDLIIPSTLFFEETKRHEEASPFLRRLRRNALFYLQMAALLLFVFLLLGPALGKGAQKTGEVLFIVDASASMLAETDGRTLFEQHRQTMGELVRGHPNSRFTVIQAGEEPEILLSRSDVPGEVLGILDGLRVTYGPEEMESTLALAVTAADGLSATAHVFTDSLEGKSLPETEGLAWRVHAAGKAPDNVSVEAFGVADTPDGRSAIAKVGNQSGAEKRITLSVRDETGQRAAEPREMTLEPGTSENIRIDGLREAAAYSLQADAEDGYEPDNEAFAVPGGRSLPVYADSRLHALVHKGLRAAGYRTLLFDPGEQGSLPDEAVVFTPDERLFIQRGGRTVLFGRSMEKSSGPPAAADRAEDSLFSFAPLEGVYVSELYPPFGDRFKTIAEAGGRPFIQRSEAGGIAVLAEPQMTDWPLRPSFPLFLWSTVDRYSAEGGGLGSFLPGELRPLPPPPGGDGWELFTAGGEFVGDTQAGRTFQAPKRPGLYLLRSAGEERYLAVVLPDSEKHPAAGQSFSSGEEGQRSGADQAGTSPAVPVLLLILALMLAEWEVQRRHGLSY